ncbi:MAG: DUF523 and DUF1722 domain-containing protein [Thermoanaerobaculia bacterium]|nr:DUF523 and DUF1722 domain-containing protein [Thermoanaerobaculia bacterium]
MGEEVRFNGGHTRDNFLVHTLSEWVEWVTVCPEFEMGLGVPRESLRLIGDVEDPSVVAPKSGTDHTVGMKTWSQQKLPELQAMNLHGFVLKRASPSCGLFRVKVYDDNGVPAAQGRGIFARVLSDAMPLLPLEEEGRLNDPRLRENFIERMFAYRRWRNLEADPSPAKLVQFHTAHKFTLMAHSPTLQVELGRLVANVGKHPLEQVLADYAPLFMTAMTKVVTAKRHTNVLQHVQGFFKGSLTREDTEELSEVIEEYRLGRVPIVVPLTLFRHHLRRHETPEWLHQQTYLKPYPSELMLRNHV